MGEEGEEADKGSDDLKHLVLEDEQVDDNLTIMIKIMVVMVMMMTINNDGYNYR